jgi:uncharacterized protein YoxC
MSDVALAAIMVAFFVLAIGLIRVLDRLINRGADQDMAVPDMADEADER